jgi:hypothetical protein
MTTKAGTSLPLLNLKGKEYLQVMHRLVWFREEKPDWGIQTRIVERTPEYALIQAIISNGQTVIATAHKREDAKHFPDFIEKAETGAVGRALAMIGYGTAFAPELDEEDRIVDSPAPVRTNAASPGASQAPGARRPIGPPPSGAAQATKAAPAPKGPATGPSTNGRTAPKSASPSKEEAQENFQNFRG